VGNINKVLDTLDVDFIDQLHYVMGKRKWGTWRDHHIIKYPEDMIAYAMVLQSNPPDYIVETGTAYGGSSMFLADILSLFNKNGKVITVDIKALRIPVHPMVTYIEGSSTDPKIVERIKGMVSGKVMVILDSSHRGAHVEREINAYSPMVTKGQFMVVEDVYYRQREYWPKWARDRFLAKTDKFKLVPICERYIVGVTRGGWLQRVADE